jgi:hypothetical protein
MKTLSNYTLTGFLFSILMYYSINLKYFYTAIFLGIVSLIFFVVDIVDKIKKGNK